MLLEGPELEGDRLVQRGLLIEVGRIKESCLDQPPLKKGTPRIAGVMAVIQPVPVSRQVDVRERDRTGATMLMKLVTTGRADLVVACLRAGADVNARDDYGGSALILGADTGNLEIVRVLLAAGADANQANSSGDTALMFAARTGDSELVHALIRSGANVKARNRDGHTALWWAEGAGWSELGAVLREAEK